MAMGRSRTRARAGWPDNLYPNREGFKYRHPVTRKETWMGKDKARAFAAARKLNALLMPGGDLVAKVTGGQKAVADAVQLFRDDEIPSRGWKPKTATWYEVFLAQIESDLGADPVADVTVNALAVWIRRKTTSARSRQTYRLLLDWIFGCALQEGWVDENPAAQLRKFHHTRQRDRLTLDVYKAIHGAAPAWLQNAMDLSLVTLLRREDIAALAFADHHDDSAVRYVLGADHDEALAYIERMTGGMEADPVSALVELRFALGDNGTRSIPELIEYARSLTPERAP